MVITVVLLSGWPIWLISQWPCLSQGRKRFGEIYVIEHLISTDKFSTLWRRYKIMKWIASTLLSITLNSWTSTSINERKENNKQILEQAPFRLSHSVMMMNPATFLQKTKMKKLFQFRSPLPLLVQLLVMPVGLVPCLRIHLFVQEEICCAMDTELEQLTQHQQVWPQAPKMCWKKGWLGLGH